MSGIFGIFNLDGAPVTRTDLRNMATLLERRGPDSTGIWHEGLAGLGHTLLATTPESMRERQPFVTTHHGEMAITADARLDNRNELIDQLGLQDRKREKLDDSELILAAYDRWREECPKHLLGAFAFVIWDGRQQQLFCARDQVGIRPFYYHHTDGRFFAFASEPRAILVLPQTPYRINEGRIADFLISQLEGIDKTSTFFETVYRLPPAHSLTVTSHGVQIEQYWTLEPGPALRLSSDEEYAEAFLDVFTEAVRCRLRGEATVGSMLSGGMDSGSIVAVARALRMQADQGPLPTFSCVGPDRETCVETRAIYDALTMDGLDSHVINYAAMDDLLPELKTLIWNLDEPFDYQMTMDFAVHLVARRHGIRAMLDGLDGDLVFSEGSYLARLLRRGNWLTAFREAKGQDHFWGGGYPVWPTLYQSARSAYVPNTLRHAMQQVHGSRREQRRFERNINTSIIRPSFARQVGLADRLKTKDSHHPAGSASEFNVERAQAIEKPILTAAVERYDRAAAVVGMEPRHPFLDRRVVAFSLSLPPAQKMAGGWPKIILRRAMAGRLPDAVRWRRSKENPGWDFTTTLMGNNLEFMQSVIQKNAGLLSDYVNMEALRQACRSYFVDGDQSQAESVYEAVCLATWLQRHKERPSVAADSNRS